MYLPPNFAVEDRQWVAGLIERYPFGLLITGDAAYPRVSHLPLICRQGETLTIIGHVARGNPHVESILAGARATIVFEGAHAYVSASWYEAPYATVPTWNYEAVHVQGTLRQFDAWEAVKILSSRMESAKAEPWDPERLGAEYRESQLRGIVAFELLAQTIYAKAKLSQNRTRADRLRVIARLLESADQTERECALAMTTSDLG